MMETKDVQLQGKAELI